MKTEVYEEKSTARSQTGNRSDYSDSDVGQEEMMKKVEAP